MSDGDQTAAAARHPAFPAPVRMPSGCGRRQDGKRRQPLWVLIRDLPCEAGPPIVADEMETPVAVANGGHDIERIADQSIHTITENDRLDRDGHRRHSRVGSARYSKIALPLLPRGPAHSRRTAIRRNHAA